MNQTHQAYQWIPSVYVMQGLPFALVTAVSPVLYKNFGLNNSFIALFTSLLTLPWILKFFVAPALEKIATKRNLILITQFLMAGLTLLLAITFYLPYGIYVSGMIFLMMAMTAAIHDINADGLYLESLTYQEQASCIGIRTVFYQLGRLSCQGGLIFAIGFFEMWGGREKTWAAALMILALGISCLAFYNQKKIPNSMVVSLEKSRSLWESTRQSYQQVVKALWQLPHVLAASIFIFLYNFPESQMNKIFPLFMLDHRAQGGLGLGVQAVGFMYGGIGLCSMLIGVTLSGFLLNRLTLKKCLVPFTVLSAFGNLSYLLIKLYFSHSSLAVCSAVICGEFGFGLSNGAFMLYVITLFAKGSYSMSLYAIGTAIMLLGMMVAGSVSGYIQTLLGYTEFFVWISAISFFMIALAMYQVKKVL